MAFAKKILEIFGDRLNMMMSEILQLETPTTGISENKLRLLILTKISKGEVNSIHMTKEEATNALNILKSLKKNKITNVRSNTSTQPPPNEFEGLPF